MATEALKMILASGRLPQLLVVYDYDDTACSRFVAQIAAAISNAGDGTSVALVCGDRHDAGVARMRLEAEGGNLNRVRYCSNVTPQSGEELAGLLDECPEIRAVIFDPLWVLTDQGKGGAAKILRPFVEAAKARDVAVVTTTIEPAVLGWLRRAFRAAVVTRRKRSGRWLGEPPVEGERWVRAK